VAATPLLGHRALAPRGVRGGRLPDAAQRRRRCGDPTPDAPLGPGTRAGEPAALCLGHDRAALRGDRRGRWGPVPRQHLARDAPAHPGGGPARLSRLDPVPGAAVRGPARFPT
jgi:hypothetical protein